MISEKDISSAFDLKNLCLCLSLRHYIEEAQLARKQAKAANELTNTDGAKAGRGAKPGQIAPAPARSPSPVDGAKPALPPPPPPDTSVRRVQVDISLTPR